jgi:hypothetical protein
MFGGVYWKKIVLYVFYNFIKYYQHVRLFSVYKYDSTEIYLFL